METIIKMIIGFTGASVSYLWGEWTALLGALLLFVVVDYVSGIAAGVVEGSLSSKVGYKGIAKKVLIFAMVAIGHTVDQILGGGHLFRDAIIFFYLANELISILENAGRVGVPIPPIIQRAVQLLREKGGDKGNNKNK